MPSRRHKAEMLSSPRRPDTTIRIFSVAENRRRVARRISRTALSAGSLLLNDFCPIFVPFGHYDEPKILPYANTSIRPKDADVRQSAVKAVQCGESFWRWRISYARTLRWMRNPFRSFNGSREDFALRQSCPKRVNNRRRRHAGYTTAMLRKQNKIDQKRTRRDPRHASAPVRVSATH